MLNRAMQIKCADFTIDLFEDVHYDPLSADNVIKYEHYYTLEDQQYRLLQRGIRVVDEEKQVVRQVCIAASGGNTGIGEIHMSCSMEDYLFVVATRSFVWQYLISRCFGKRKRTR